MLWRALIALSDSVESYSEPASTEYSDISTVDYNAPPPDTPGPSIPPSPRHTRNEKIRTWRSGIVDMIGLLLAQYATKAMLNTAAKTAMRDTLNAVKKVVPHLIAHKVASTIAAAAKKQKRVDIDAKHSQETQLKEAFVDTGGIDINALINGSGIVLD